MNKKGTRLQVMRGTALKTTCGLYKKDLLYNKYNKIVSKKISSKYKKMVGGVLPENMSVYIFKHYLTEEYYTKHSNMNRGFDMKKSVARIIEENKKFFLAIFGLELVGIGEVDNSVSRITEQIRVNMTRGITDQQIKEYIYQKWATEFAMLKSNIPKNTFCKIPLRVIIKNNVPLWVDTLKEHDDKLINMYDTMKLDRSRYPPPNTYQHSSYDKKRNSIVDHIIYIITKLVIEQNRWNQYIRDLVIVQELGDSSE